jgi:hypothetical protein
MIGRRSGRERQVVRKVFAGGREGTGRWSGRDRQVFKQSGMDKQVVRQG